MAKHIHKGYWYLKLLALTASLLAVLLVIDYLRFQKIQINAVAPAEARDVTIPAKIDKSKSDL